jgi:hypothetical protein
LEKRGRLLSQCLSLCLNPKFTKLNHPKLLNLPYLRLNPNPNPNQSILRASLKAYLSKLQKKERIIPGAGIKLAG